MFLERIPVRFRLSLGYAIWMALLFIGIGCGVYKLVQRNLDKSVDAALIASAESLRSARAAINYRSPFTQSFLREFFGEDHIRPYAQLVDLSGRVSAKTQNVRVSLPVTPYAIRRAEHGFLTIESVQRHGMPPLRQITMPIMRSGKFTGELVQVGAPLDATYRTLRSISLMLWLVLPIGLGLSIIFGYLLTAWSLKPVVGITRTAAKLGSDDLNVRLKLPAANDEIRELSSTFNGMLDRLQDTFDRMKRFAGDVSHELRTPLTVLRGEAEFALRKERDSESYRQTLEIIVRESLNMTTIVEDLLLLARTQSKSVAMEWELVEFKQIIDPLVDSTKAVFDEKNITLKVSQDSPSDHPTFYTSHGYLNLALKNLLLNAVKHSPKGSEIKLESSSTISTVSFAIIDPGEGIPKESLPYIFDTFYRADTARNRGSGGVGIGLSLAQALVSLHNGTIEVESELGVGTTFKVTIPREKPRTELTKKDVVHVQSLRE